MADIYDYLGWQGHIPFAQAAVNEADFLILSWLAYVDWQGVLPGPGEGAALPLPEAANAYFLLHPQQLEKEKPYAVNPYVSGANLLKRLMDCPRFYEIQLCGFADETDIAQEKQFSAIACITKDWGAACFRGTDTTFVGWKEDFRLAITHGLPAHLAAAEYVDRVPQLQEGALYFCGHSKGGNLAIYGAAKAAGAVRRRIAAVYSFDGPGFTPDFVQDTDYQEMLPRMRSFIPQASVVGLLMENAVPHTVVKSKGVSILQHMALHWQVGGTAFLPAKRITLPSRLLDVTLKKWLGRLTKQEKNRLIDLLFSLLEATGVQRIEELNRKILRHLARAIRKLAGLSWTEKKMLLRVIFLLVWTWHVSAFRIIFRPRMTAK